MHRGLLTGLLISLSSGCDVAGALALQWMELEPPSPTASRDATFPPAGAMAWSGDFALSIFLEDPADFDVLSVELEHRGNIETPTCTLDERAVVQCLLEGEVPEDRNFTLRTSFGDAVSSTRFSSKVPQPGQAFRFSEGLQVTRAGGARSTANLLDTALQSMALGAVLTDDAILLGAADYQDDGAMAIEAPGLTMPLAITSTRDGVIEASASTAFLPLSDGGRLVLLRVLDCEATATVDAAGLHIVFDGVVDPEGQDTLASLLDVSPAVVAGVLDPDVDLDGDGRDESLRLSLESDAPESPLRAWTGG